MKIGIIGYGWLAERIGEALKKEQQVFGTTRNLEKKKRLSQKGITMLLWDKDKLSTEDTEALMQCDVLISSLPVSKVRFDATTLHNLLRSIEGYAQSMIVFSSTGVYPQDKNTYNESHTENLNPNILAYEQFFRKYFPQSVILRFGGLMGDNRRFENYFKNKPIPNPNSPVNHIHYRDIISIIQLIIDRKITAETYNVVAPFHPSKAEVLSKQTNKNITSHEKVSYNGRIISSEKLIKEFDYSFIKPNPAAF